MRAGRGLGPADEAPGARPVAVVHEALWQVLAGLDARLDGRTVFLNGQEFSVVGIVEPRFHGIEIGRDIRLWVPLAHLPALDTAGQRLTERRMSWLTILGRRRPDVTFDAAAADLNRVESVLKDVVSRGENRTLLAVPGRQGDSSLAARTAPVLQLLLGAAALVLVVGVANVASLLVSRTFERQRELAVRSALGASRLRLVRLQMTETLLIGVAAGAAALVLTQWAARLSAPLLLAQGDALALDVGLGWRMTGVVFGLALAAIAAASLAVVATGSGRPLWASLGDGGRAASSGPLGHRVRRGLVVVQFAVSLALVVSAALLVRTVFNVIAIPTGLNVDRVALLGVDPRAAGFDAARARQYVAEAERRLRLVPGVRAAGYAFVPPLGFGGSRATIAVPGYTPAPDEDLEINFNIVSPGYFDALGIALSDGRALLERDANTGPIAVVVNETMARRYWPDGRAIGRAFAFAGATGAGFEVVGVARDVKYRTIREASMPSFYYSIHRTARASSGVFQVLTAGDPDSALDDLRRALGAVDPAVPVMIAHTLREQRNRNLANERLAMTIGAVLGGAALLMAAVGLFAAMSHAVGRRTREIGVRMALGAVPSGVARLVLGEGARLVAAGALAGVGLAYWLGQAVKERLYGVGPYDPVSILVAAGILAAVTLVAAWAPARRAARVDPTTALRE
jgi:predicted permease